MRIGILTGGGDVPGLNPCIRALTLSAIDLGWDVVGFRRGWLGRTGDRPRRPASVRGEQHPRLPGNACAASTGWRHHAPHLARRPRARPQRRPDGDVLHILDRLGVDAMVTLAATARFASPRTCPLREFRSSPFPDDGQRRVRDATIASASRQRSAGRSRQSNALRTTVESHERFGVVELFGRRSGETALLAGFLAQVDRTVISEVPAELDQLIPLLQRDKATNPAAYAMCVISEGASLGDSSESDLSKPASQRDEQGIGQRLAREIEARTGDGTVMQELAYLMRAGEPDAMDRLAGLAFGALAIQLLAAGTHGRMLALLNGNYGHVAIDTLLGGTKRVDVERFYDPVAYRARLQAVNGMPMFLY
jgi:6-phosphofructokinase 1